MDVVRVRGATKKLGPRKQVLSGSTWYAALTRDSLGSKTVCFKLRESKRQFAVHEDLICRGSKHFKERLQKKRKDVNGDCPVCHEALTPDFNDVTFCRAKCGQNFHDHCIESWLEAQSVPTSCPMCREPWKKKGNHLTLHDKTLDADSVKLYLDWLYMGSLRFDEQTDPATDEFDIMILNAWHVSSVLGDPTFGHALVAEHISSLEKGQASIFGTEAINFAFGDKGSPYMQKYVVDACFAESKGKASWVEKRQDSLPIAFVVKLYATAREAVGRPGRAHFLRKYTSGQYVIE